LLNQSQEDEYYVVKLLFRLVINLMLINVVSCLFLFPSILIDLSKNSDLILSSSNATATAELTTTASNLALCVWGTAFSSFVSHSSVLAMLAVGKYILLTHFKEVSS
jgi:hypothetical protein